jgi:hypothetical protein
MKKLKYLLVCLVVLASFSCSEDPILRTGGEDDEVVLPPPPPIKPQSTTTVELDSLTVEPN